MSILDREPRTSSGRSTPFIEPRVAADNTIRPARVNQPSKPPAKLPRGPVLTGTEKRMPVKR